MVRECVVPECSTHARFNHPGESHGVFCSKHKEDGMRCVHASWLSAPSSHPMPYSQLPNRSAHMYIQSMSGPPMHGIAFSYSPYPYLRAALLIAAHDVAQQQAMSWGACSGCLAGTWCTSPARSRAARPWQCSTTPMLARVSTAANTSRPASSTSRCVLVAVHACCVQGAGSS